MQSHFTSEFFANNRRSLRAKSGTDAVIVVAGNGLLQRGADSAFRFSQDANFWYLTGVDEPDAILVMTTDEEYLIVPPRDDSRTAFDGEVDDAALVERSGISKVLASNPGWRRLLTSLQADRQVALVPPPPAYVERYGMFMNPARQAVQDKLHTEINGLNVIDISLAIVHLRMIKQTPELKALQAAIDITLKTIKTVATPAKLKRYSHEYQLEAALGHGFRALGSSGHAFDPIVAGGSRACTLHYVSNNSQLADGEMIVIDVGAEVEHYAADISRTVTIGPAIERNKEVYAAVADVQQYAYGLLKPGVKLREYEKQVEHYMGETLIKLKVITENTTEEVRKYYPHSTSHFLGLNVHDIGDYDLPLAPGMVVTVEPGIYLPAEGIGVRVEDDVLITKSGIRILSTKYPMVNL